MDVKGLKIGNLIQCDSKVLEVECINTNKCFDCGSIDSRSESENGIIHRYSIDFCEPIPLTEEWLTKFGFKFDRFLMGPDANDPNGWVRYAKLGDGDITKKFDLLNMDSVLKKYIIIISRGRFIFSLNWMSCFPEIIEDLKFVHVLQNIWSDVAGEELTLI